MGRSKLKEAKREREEKAVKAREVIEEAMNSLWLKQAKKERETEKEKWK